MKIRSNFRDYYDSLQAYWDANAPTYDRNNVEEPIVKEEIPKPEIHAFLGSRFRASAGAVYFCGEIYPFLKIWGYGGSPDDSMDDMVEKFFYTIDDVESYLRESFQNASKRERKNRENVLSNCLKNLDVFEKHHYEFIRKYIGQHPIGILKTDYGLYFERNGCLEYVGFEQIKNPYETFQALSQWVSNNAAPEPVIPDIDDKSMAASKGFDKLSFRKAPTKFPRKK